MLRAMLRLICCYAYHIRAAARTEFSPLIRAVAHSVERTRDARERAFTLFFAADGAI